MPIYEYKCPECMHIQEVLLSVSDLDTVGICCEACGEKCIRIISKCQARPVVMDYYSENADAHFTGPKQKARILREKNLEPAE
jgi:putative FmdB family regulatory protein